MLKLLALRLRTAQCAYKLEENISRTVGGKKNKPNIIVSALLRIARIIGAGLFFGSVGVLAAPLFTAIDPLLALSGFVSIQVASWTFTKVPELYHESMATLWWVQEAAANKKPGDQLAEARGQIWPARQWVMDEIPGEDQPRNDDGEVDAD